MILYKTAKFLFAILLISTAVGFSFIERKSNMKRLNSFDKATLGNYAKTEAAIKDVRIMGSKNTIAIKSGRSAHFYDLDSNKHIIAIKDLPRGNYQNGRNITLYYNIKKPTENILTEKEYKLLMD